MYLQVPRAKTKEIRSKVWSCDNWVMVIHKMDPNYFLPDTIASRYMHGRVTSLFIGVMGTVVEKRMAQSLHVGLSPNDCSFSSLNYWFELYRFPHPLSHWILDRLQKRAPSKKCWPMWMWHDVMHLSTCSVAKLLSCTKKTTTNIAVLGGSCHSVSG